MNVFKWWNGNDVCVILESEDMKDDFWFVRETIVSIDISNMAPVFTHIMVKAVEL